MTTENNVECRQTRAMTKAQRIEEEAHREVVDNQEQVQGTNPLPITGQGTPNTGTQIPAMNPTVNRHRTDKELIMEFVMKECTIGLDWYVPNFCNTWVAAIIKERLPIETTEGKILFNCPLQGFLPNSNLRVRSQNRLSVHIPKPPRGHRNTMPTGGI